MCVSEWGRKSEKRRVYVYKHEMCVWTSVCVCMSVGVYEHECMCMCVSVYEYAHRCDLKPLWPLRRGHNRIGWAINSGFISSFRQCITFKHISPTHTHTWPPLLSSTSFFSGPVLPLFFFPTPRLPLRRSLHHNAQPNQSPESSTIKFHDCAYLWFPFRLLQRAFINLPSFPRSGFPF